MQPKTKKALTLLAQAGIAAVFGSPLDAGKKIAEGLAIGAVDKLTADRRKLTKRIIDMVVEDFTNFASAEGIRESTLNDAIYTARILLSKHGLDPEELATYDLDADRVTEEIFHRAGKISKYSDAALLRRIISYFYTTLLRDEETRSNIRAALVFQKEVLRRQRETDKVLTQVKNEVEGLPEKLLATQDRRRLESAKPEVLKYISAVKHFALTLPYKGLPDVEELSIENVLVPTLMAVDTSPMPKSVPVPLRVALEMITSGSGPSHMRIIGESGSGKSTLIRFVCRHAWDNHQAIGLRRPYLTLPLRMRAITEAEGLSKGDVFLEALKHDKQLFFSGVFIPSGEFFTLWSQCIDAPWLILLDGLDEVNDATNRNELWHKILGIANDLSKEGHHLIVTSRPLTLRKWQETSELFSSYELLPLKPKQQIELSRKWLRDRTDRFWDDIKRRGRFELLSIPLVLTFAVGLYLENGNRLFERRTDIYKAVIESWLREWKRRGLTKELGPDVADYAWQLVQELGRITTENREDSSERLIRPRLTRFLSSRLGLVTGKADIAAGHFLSFMADQSGILVQRNDNFEWVHSIFREYLTAAAYTESGISEQQRQNLVLSRWRMDDWHNTLILLLGLWSEFGDVSPILRRIMTTDRKGAMFCGRAISEGTRVAPQLEEEITQQIIDEVKNYAANFQGSSPCEAAVMHSPSESPIRILGMLRLSERALNDLVRYANDERQHEYVREDAIDALAARGCTKELEHLRKNGIVSDRLRTKIKTTVEAFSID
jgi:NACHT domain